MAGSLSAHAPPIPGQPEPQCFLAAALSPHQGSGAAGSRSWLFADSCPPVLPLSEGCFSPNLGGQLGEAALLATVAAADALMAF